MVKFASMLLAAIVASSVTVSEPVENQSITVNDITITTDEAASEAEGKQVFHVGDMTFTLSETEEPATQPRRQIYSETLNGQQSFIAVFACAGANGKTVTITVNNTGSSDIIMRVAIDGVYGDGELIFPAGTNLTATATKDDGGAISGEFWLNMTTSSADGIYCTLTVNQS